MIHISLSDGLHTAAHALGNFHEHEARLVGMNLLFIFGILLGGIFLRLLKREARHLALGASLHGGVEAFLGEVVVEVHIANHRGFKHLKMLLRGIGVITNKHVAGNLDENGRDVDGTQERSEEHGAIHAVDLRRIEGIFKRADRWA